jgi:hypothetical protein
MKITTIGTFGFIKFPNVKVLLFPEDKPLNQSIANGVKKTIYPKLMQTQPSNHGVTKAYAKDYFPIFNSLHYDRVVDYKLQN